MALWKRLLITLLVLVLAGGGAAAAAICLPMAVKSEEKPNVNFKAGEKPYFEGEEMELDGIIIPSDDDTAGHKALAYKLYMIANNKHQQTANAAIYANCVTTTKLLNATVDANDYRFTIKNGDTYFYSEYSFAADEGGQSVLGLFSPESTLFAQMQYSDADMKTAYQEKVVYPTPTRTTAKEIEGLVAAGTLPADTVVPIEGQIFNVNWASDDLRISTIDKPVYSASQEEQYYGTGQNITPETIKSAKVSYNEKEHFYTMTVELDVNNPLTTKDTLSQLRGGFGNDTAHYTSMVETIEIWDNGYYKNFLSVDCWGGTMVIPMDFVLSFDMTYYYDANSVNIGNYQYAEDFILRATAAK